MILLQYLTVCFEINLTILHDIYFLLFIGVLSPVVLMIRTSKAVECTVDDFYMPVHVTPPRLSKQNVAWF